ncbi:MAG: cell division protein ZapD [Candidatus Polarisedimenticolaceae bacterium]|nr:cell division protein ZapD [Candidatus Polarisedimenticolaceae bacterium]
MSNQIIYEHPLNERVRTLLRLEHLFTRIAFHLPQPDEWSSRATIGGLLDITNILARADIRSEVIKELERHTASLNKIRSAPGVDSQQLDLILADLEQSTNRMRRITTQIGRGLRENEFLGNIMQRSTIPGGTCDFDLPQYHYWLQQPVETRHANLQGWFQELEVLQGATRLLLSLMRNSANASQAEAKAGLYQRTLESQSPAQLIRVGLPEEAVLFPEISGSKHRFTIRFLEPSSSGRPNQTQLDVGFSLICCIF